MSNIYSLLHNYCDNKFISKNDIDEYYKSDEHKYDLYELLNVQNGLYDSVKTVCSSNIYDILDLYNLVTSKLLLDESSESDDDTTTSDESSDDDEELFIFYSDDEYMQNLPVSVMNVLEQPFSVHINNCTVKTTYNNALFGYIVYHSGIIEWIENNKHIVNDLIRSEIRSIYSSISF